MITRLGVVRKNWIWIVAIVAAALILAFLIRLLNNSGQPHVPPEFLKARAVGEDASQVIVGISNNSIKNLQEIQADEKNGNYTAGLNLVLEEINQNNQARASAVQLSGQLNIMASNLSTVQPESAARIGLQAIIIESQIVEGLINYNNYTYQLLDLLHNRLQNGAASAPAAKINSVISQMNDQAKSINNLNTQYQSLMKQFDQMTNS